MRRRVLWIIFVLVAWGGASLFPGSVTGLHSWASSTGRPQSVVQTAGPVIGRPLPDRDIRIRARGIGVYPIQVHPGVIYGEDGPVKLWDEVSVEHPDRMRISALDRQGNR